MNNVTPILRPEVSKAVTDISNAINSFSAFLNNYDDAHFDMFLEAVVQYNAALDRFIAIPSFVAVERPYLKNFLSVDCRNACDKLMEYAQGRKNYLKVDYDISVAVESQAKTTEAINKVSAEDNTNEASGQTNSGPVRTYATPIGAHLGSIQENKAAS